MHQNSYGACGPIPKMNPFNPTHLGLRLGATVGILHGHNHLIDDEKSGHTTSQLEV
jgi:hypothetical protein